MPWLCKLDITIYCCCPWIQVTLPLPFARYVWWLFLSLSSSIDQGSDDSRCNHLLVLHGKRRQMFAWSKDTLSPLQFFIMMPWLIYVANVILGIGAAVIWTAQVIQKIPTTIPLTKKIWTFSLSLSTGQCTCQQLRSNNHHTQLWRLLGDEHVFQLHWEHSCLLTLQSEISTNNQLFVHISYWGSHYKGLNHLDKFLL